MNFTRLSQWLRQPFPLLNDHPRIWRVALTGCLFVLFFLFFFQPFGLQPLDESAGRLFIICLEYGLVTLGTLLLWGYSLRSLPGIFQEANWRVWKEILANLAIVTLIALANLLFTHFRYGMPLSWRLFWNWQVITWGVGIFPTLYGVFHKQLRLMQRYGKEANSLTATISHPMGRRINYLNSQVILSGDNQGETLSVPADHLAYLTAADNYVQVFYFEQAQLKSRMLRTTLKKMEDALAAFPQFFRCHRTYLVNLDKVASVSGNAQGYRLHLAGLADTVPVSRNLNGVIRERFGYIHHL